MCGMGMSAAITQSEVIVGSPGSFEWQGDSILFYSILMFFFLFTQIQSKHLSSEKFSAVHGVCVCCRKHPRLLDEP